MRCLIDAQLPPALARWLAAEGHEASHVSDVGLAQATDAAIWQHAADTASVIVTKDEDFALRAQLMAGGPQVVWVRDAINSNRPVYASSMTLCGPSVDKKQSCH